MRPLTPIAYCYSGALVVVGALLLAGSISLTAPLIIGVLVFGLLPAPLLVHWALQLEDQYEWLIKGHAKERATEVVTPPKQFRPFIKKLEADVSHAAQLLMKFESSWQRRAFAGQWYAMAVATVVGVVGLAALFFYEALPTVVVSYIPNTPWAILSTLTLGLCLAVASYIACAIVIKAADENAEKLAHYLEQKSDQKVTITPLKPTSMVPAIGIVAVLALIPVTILQSNFEEQKTVQQKAIAETQEVAKSLEERLDETLEKKDFFATENAGLLEKNQALITELEQFKKTDKLLRTEIDKLKADAVTTAKEQEALNTKLADTQKSLATTEANLAEQTKAKDTLTAEKAKLAKELSALKTSKAAADKISTELTNKVAMLEEQITTLKAQAAKAEQALKDVKAAQQPLVLDGAMLTLLPALAKLGPENQSLIMPADVFFTPQTDTEETYFMNNVKDLVNILDAKVKKTDGYALKAYVYADALPPVTLKDNMALTAAQAAKLANALKAQGMPEHKVMVIPMGNAHEVDSRLDPEALEANRRIVFMVAPTAIGLNTPEGDKAQN